MPKQNLISELTEEIALSDLLPMAKALVITHIFFN